MNINENCYRRIKDVLYLSIILLIFIISALSYTLGDHREPEDSDIVKAVNKDNSSENHFSDVMADKEGKNSTDISTSNSIHCSCEHNKQSFEDSRNIQILEENENNQLYEDNNTEHYEDNNSRSHEDENEEYSGHSNNMCSYEDNYMQLDKDNNTGHNEDSTSRPREDKNIEFNGRNIRTQSNEGNNTEHDVNIYDRFCEDINNEYTRDNNNIKHGEDRNTRQCEDQNNEYNDDNNDIQPNEDNTTGYNENIIINSRESSNNEYIGENDNTQPRGHNSTERDVNTNSRPRKDKNSEYNEYNNNMQPCEDTYNQSNEDSYTGYDEDTNFRLRENRKSEYSEHNNNMQPFDDNHNQLNEENNTGHNVNSNSRSSEDFNNEYIDNNDIQSNEDNKTKQNEGINISPREGSNNGYIEDNDNTQPREYNNTKHDEDSNRRPREDQNNEYTEDNDDTQPNENKNVQINEVTNTLYDAVSDSRPLEYKNSEYNGNNNDNQPNEYNSAGFNDNSNSRPREDGNNENSEEKNNTHPCEIYNILSDRDSNSRSREEKNSEYIEDINDNQSNEYNSTRFYKYGDIQLCGDNDAQTANEKNNTLRPGNNNNKQTDEHSIDISSIQNHKRTHFLAITPIHQHSDELQNTKANEVNNNTQTLAFKEKTCFIKHTRNLNAETPNEISNTQHVGNSCSKSFTNFKNSDQLDTYKHKFKIPCISAEKQINDYQIESIRQPNRNNSEINHIQTTFKVKYERQIKVKNRSKNQTCKQPLETVKTQESIIESQSTNERRSVNKSIPIVATNINTEKMDPSTHSLLPEDDNIPQLETDTNKDFQLIVHKPNLENKKDLLEIHEQLTTLKSSEYSEFHRERNWLQVFYEHYTEYTESLDKWESKLCDLLNDFYIKFFKKQQGLFYQNTKFQLQLPFNNEIFNGQELISLFEEKLNKIYEIFINNNIDTFKELSQMNNDIDYIIEKDLKTYIQCTHCSCNTPHYVINVKIFKIIILERELNELQLNHIAELIKNYNKWICIFKDIFKAVPPEFEDLRGIDEELTSDLKDINAYKYELQRRRVTLESIYNSW